MAMKLLVIKVKGGYHTATLAGGQLTPEVTTSLQHAYSWSTRELEAATQQANLVGGTVEEVEFP